MAVTHKLYGPVMKNIANGNIGDLGSTAAAPITVYLMSSDHTFTQNHEYWSAISANETTDADYSEKILGNPSVTYGDNRITTLAATSETEFASSGSIKARYAVLAASSYLVSCVDFGQTEESVDGQWKINWHADGILTITVSS